MGGMGRGHGKGEVDAIQHEVSSGDPLGPAAQPQLSVLVSLFRAALLLGWVDRRMSPKASEFRSLEQAPCSTARLPCTWPGVPGRLGPL